MLRQIDDGHLKDTVLAGRTPFRDADGKTWVQRQGSRKDDWADQALQGILETLSRRHGRLDPDPCAVLTAARLSQPDDCLPEQYVDQIVKGHADSEGREALGFLRDWLADPKGDIFCAIFGELGMGKTTLCQRLTRDLLARRAKEPELPLPVYLDLRAVNSLDWDWSRGVPELEPMLDRILADAYNLPVDSPRPSIDDIRRLAQRQGGLVIFDGLDEVMNRLTPEHCVRFIGQIWSILPKSVWDPEDGTRPAGVGRLIMTCRSHFFQTLQEQLDTLSGRQRETVGRKDYLWVDLLPFDAGQVETYFRQVFAADPQQADQVLEMLDQVHDLRELGSRPYNLRLIQDQVERIEGIHRQGGHVGVADLYDGLVHQWTRRDSPKHRLDQDHKLLLMEALAHRLWARRARSLDYLELEGWLLDQLATDPRAQLRYKAYLEKEGGLGILQEDLRNASFLVRDGEEGFRFAHSSIMEFFLARALFRALERAGDPAETPLAEQTLEQALAAWAVPVPSPETLDFLGELLRESDGIAWRRAFHNISKRYRPKVSELTLAYALHALQRGLPAPAHPPLAPARDRAPVQPPLAQVLQGHQGWVLACAFSPDGRRLLSAGDDRSLRLWDPDSGEALTIIQMLPNGEHAVLEPNGAGFRSASPGAWRWLGWLVEDPETGRTERLPAETYGPIPGMDP